MVNKENAEEAFWFYVDVFNPLAIMDISSYGTRRGLTQKAVGLGLIYTAAKMVSGPLSGGGAHHQVAKDISRMTWRSIPALKADSYRALAVNSSRILSTGARAGFRSLPGVSAMIALYGTGQFLQGLYHDLSGMYIGDMRFVR